MSKIENTSEQNDFFAIWKENTDNYFSSLEKATTQYNHALSNLVSDHSKAWNNSIDSSIDVVKEFVHKTGRKTSIPTSFARTVIDLERDFIKSIEVHKIISVSTIEAARNHLKAINENSISFANSSKNLIDSLITVNPKN